MDIFQQLGDLFLSAIPTVIIVFLFYFFLRWSFFKPITRVMNERAARIEGARRDAEALQAEAEEKRRVHLESLRKARAQIFAEQEVARRSALDERAATIQQARSTASEEVQAGRKRISAELEDARGELEAAGKQLAEEIVRSILQKPQLILQKPQFTNTPVGEVQ